MQAITIKNICAGLIALLHTTTRKQAQNPPTFPAVLKFMVLHISHFQEIIEWNQLQAIATSGDTIKFQFVYIKATQGILIEDDMFEEYWEDSKDHHITHGAYHYFVADRNPKQQAAKFIGNVKLRKGDLPPAVDVEDMRGLSQEELVSALQEFLDEIENNYHIKPIIYSNIHFIEDHLADDFKNYDFWISNYQEEEPDIDEGIHWLFWQHSKKADLLGINVNADADVFNGSRLQFDSILVK